MEQNDKSPYVHISAIQLRCERAVMFPTIPYLLPGCFFEAHSRYGFYM